MTMPLLDPTAIHPGFVPKFRDAVAAVPVQDEAVLYEEDTGALHQLDVIATTVCSLIDGETSVATMADELAEAFEADREVIEADVLAMMRELGRKGLFEGVEGDQVAESSSDDTEDGDPGVC